MLLGLHPLELLCLLLAGVVLDRLLGEPRRFHPLVGFGNLASLIERTLNRAPQHPLSRLTGALALALAVLPLSALVAWLTTEHAATPVAWAIHALALYAALGATSLKQHIAPIATALEHQQLDQARALTARIVSRDTTNLDQAGIARAAVESALENGNDAVFGTLFWFILLGAPGAVLFRLANTLDAMWGYRNRRFLYFGWAAARFDDLLNLAPARLTALTYAVLGSTRNALLCWRTQARAWSSPNAGPVMASGAGALRVALGGAAIYEGAVESRPPLGNGATPDHRHIVLALRMVDHGVLLWIGCVAVVTAVTMAVALSSSAHA